MELQALTGRLYIIDGVPQDDNAVPGLLAQPAPSRVARGRERDFLFAHVTLTGRPDETAELSNRLVGAISRDYFQTPGSVTAALRKVLNDINEKLLRFNLNAGTSPREGAVTCAVLRQNELYVVQVGESLAMVGHNFGVERLPAQRPPRITPLGRTAGIDFRYYHQRLQPGDMLLLADPRMAPFDGNALTPVLVDTEVELGLAELVELVGSDTARALLVEFTDEPPDGATPVVTPVIEQGRIKLPGKKKKVAAATVIAAAAQPVREQPLRETAPPPDTASRPPVRADATPRPSPAVSADTGEMADKVVYSARQAASRGALGLSTFTAWLADFMGHIRAPAAADEATETEQTPHESKSHWAIPAIIAIVIPLLVAVIVSGVYLQRGRVQQVADIKAQMSENLVLGAETLEPLEARDYYQTVLTLAVEADALRPGDVGVSSMRAEALIALDEIDGISRLAATPFYAFGQGTELTAVTVRDDFSGGVYVLDSVNSSVYELPTDESFTNLTTSEPVRLTYFEQPVGTHIVQNIVDIIWRRSGSAVQRDGLVMLDAAGAAVAYYPSALETRASELGLSSNWQAPVAAALYSERLYVLDPGAAAIWKYLPEDEGFNVAQGELTLEVPDADLAAAGDLDLYSEDGSLLLTYPDGRVRYYDTRTGRVYWNEADLIQSGLPAPLQSPAAGKLVGRGLNASIFILDAGTGRVIQVSRGGALLAQYRAVLSNGEDAFTGATDFAVTENPLRIFVTRGDTVYQATQ